MSKVLKQDYVVMSPSEICCSSSFGKVAREKTEQAVEKAEAAIPKPVLKDNMERTQEIVSSANAKAEKIIEEAKRTAGIMYKEAYEKGIEKGRQEGVELAMKEEKTAVDELKQLCGQLEENDSKRANSMLDEAVDFAFSIAEKILNTEIDRNDKVFVNICKEAISNMAGPKSVMLKVGENRYGVISRNLAEIRNSVEGLEHIEIELDEKHPDLCRVETETGTADASIENRIKKAKQLLNITY